MDCIKLNQRCEELVWCLCGLSRRAERRTPRIIVATLTLWYICTAKPYHRSIATSRGGYVNGFDTARQAALTSKHHPHDTHNIFTYSIHIRRHIDTFCTHLTAMANIVQHFYDATSRSWELDAFLLVALHNHHLGVLFGCFWIVLFYEQPSKTQNALVVSSGGGDDPFESVLWLCEQYLRLSELG